MRFSPILETAGLALLTLSTSAMASPTELVKSSLDAAIDARAAPVIPTYRADAIKAVLTLASELLGVQSVGAAINPSELELLCVNFTPNGSSRLKTQGYDIDMIKNIICAGAVGYKLPTLDLIGKLTRQISTEIWIVQAIGAVTGNGGVQKLCDLINVKAADAIGLQGDLVKKAVCDAAVVAKTVSSTDKPASYTLKPPVVDSIAPVSKVVLPFVPA